MQLRGVIGDLLVKTQSCYAAICDEASPVNRLGFMAAALETSKQEAVTAREEEFFSLFRFNDRLLQLAANGELLSWTLLLDGVFRAVALAEPPPAASEPVQRNLGSSFVMADLVCPTGRLTVTCLASLGQSQKPFLVVEPGIYRVSLQRSESAEMEHSCLESVSEYSLSAVPDWRFHIQRI